MLSVFTANYNNILGIPGIVLKTVFGFIGILYAAKIIYDMIKMLKHKYTHEVLLKDIENLEEILIASITKMILLKMSVIIIG